LVTKAIFDADSGLWLSSEGNQMLMRINPASEVSCPDDHLIYFRFLGRVLGKALFEGQIVSGHMVQYVYKYMLGWPITFNDLESVDQDVFENLKKLLEMNSDEIEYMCLDFTAAQSLLGEITQVGLIPDGEGVAVTGENLSEYLESYFKYLMLDRIKPQVAEFLLGFYDVIPEGLLTVFDYQELELMLCGLPTFDMIDWKKNTIYAGTFESSKEKSNPCKWFWEIVTNEFDQEMRARLLQFVTGTSGVPSRGFSVLQGSDGHIKLFTLNGIDMKGSAYPRSHTCFNRLDLPMYKSKSDLREKLKIAITHCATGFHLE
jgi:E3 ubiquitin-protein ligase NEDD4